MAPGGSLVPGGGANGLALASLLMLVTACGGLAGSNPVPSVPPSFTGSPRPVAPGQAARHVFLIVMENKSPTEVLSGPYVRSLADRYAFLTNYHDVGSPSLPNYLALTSGSTWGISDDGFHVLQDVGIGQQLTARRRSWRAYIEGLTAGCLDSPYPYAVKHNPFAYYGGQCPSNVVPFSQFAGDLAGQIPQFTWVTPDMCHDTHDCPVSTGDAWLSRVVPQILGTSAWQNNGVLFIVWDESHTDTVPALVVAPHVRKTSLADRFDHYSVLAAIQDLLGLPRLGSAQQASSLAGIISG